jgi:hypothetical protein
MSILTFIAIAVPLLVGAGYLLFFMWFNAPVLRKTSGDWVADIWLTSHHGLGVTMYRQRYQSKWAAYLDCKLRAIGLDMVLPTSYWVEDDAGKPVRLPYQFAIQQTVRNLGPLEHKDFNPCWVTELPHEAVFRGYLVTSLQDPADVLAA